MTESDDLPCLCEGYGCALCLGDEWPEREAELIREKYGDRRAIEREQVAPLFGIKEDEIPF